MAKFAPKWVLGTLGFVLLAIALIACGTTQAKTSTDSQAAANQKSSDPDNRPDNRSETILVEHIQQSREAVQKAVSEQPLPEFKVIMVEPPRKEGAVFPGKFQWGLGTYTIGVDKTPGMIDHNTLGARLAMAIGVVSGACTKKPANWCYPNNYTRGSSRFFPFEDDIIPMDLLYGLAGDIQQITVGLIEGPIRYENVAAQLTLTGFGVYIRIEYETPGKKLQTFHAVGEVYVGMNGPYLEMEVTKDPSLTKLLK